jgi:hypothetical protein
MIGACDVFIGAQGTVRTSVGEPISGATVKLEVPGGKSVETISDPDGRYSITKSTWGHPAKRLTVLKSGFKSYSVELPSTPDLATLDITLTPDK